MSITKKYIEGFTRQLADALKIGQSIDVARQGTDTRNIVIAGMVLANGNGLDRVIVRGIGPSLAPTFFPASAVLANPTLELRDGNGALLISNNDWQDDVAQAALIAAAGLAPTNNLESAIAASLPPGLYTAILAGFNNGTGIGLVEVYDLGP